MTVKQAESINNKFKSLEDSIAILNAKLNGCVTSFNFTENKVNETKEKLDNTTKELFIVNDSLKKITILYLNEVKRQDKLEFIDKKTRTQIKLGLFGVTATWLYGILSK